MLVGEVAAQPPGDLLRGAFVVQAVDHRLPQPAARDQLRVPGPVPVPDRGPVRIDSPILPVDRMRGDLA